MLPKNITYAEIRIGSSEALRDSDPRLRENQSIGKMKRLRGVAESLPTIYLSKFEEL
jgi:hypothetical protein